MPEEKNETQVVVKSSNSLCATINDKTFCMQMPEGTKIGELTDACLVMAEQLNISIAERIANMKKQKEEFDKEEKELEVEDATKEGQE